MPRRPSAHFYLRLCRRLELNTGKRGFVLAKVYSMRVPVHTVARGKGFRLLSRVLQSVLHALQDSRKRQARRIIEDYRRRCDK
jgi:hypothetical protein